MNKLSKRLKALERTHWHGERKPLSYESYIMFSKMLTHAHHPMMGRIMIGRLFNEHAADKVPVPEFCLSRADYEAIEWEGLEQCGSWIVERCKEHRNT